MVGLMRGFMHGFMFTFLVGSLLFRSPKNGEKVFVLNKFRRTETCVLATFKNVCGTGSHLLDIAG